MSGLKIVSVVGARPQFVKAAVMSRCLREHQHHEVLVHTGQHYDPELSDVFFGDLEMAAPDYNLEVGSGTHANQTAAMLVGLEEILRKESPDWVVVYGDTNSTLAGALAASKLQMKIAHVEAGLRSFNRQMPEEINRIVTDHLSDLLLCPSRAAMDNASREGLAAQSVVIGDVMAEALAFAAARADSRSDILRRLGLIEREFVLATVHRAENTDDPLRLREIVDGLGRCGTSVVLPLHPRTRQALTTAALSFPASVMPIAPVGYLDMAKLVSKASLVATDSGGLQKEAYWLGVPCVTLRNETEWVETLETGWNILAGADAAKIERSIRGFRRPAERPALYTDGGGTKAAVTLLEQRC